MAPTAAIERRILFINHTPQGHPASPDRTIGRIRCCNFAVGRCFDATDSAKGGGMMRSIGLLAALLPLAACAPEKAAETSTNETAASPATPPSPAAAPAGPSAATTPPPRPAMEDAIPAAFHGRYDASREACGRPSDGRLTVSAGELRFHESIGSVRKVASGPAGAIRVEAVYQGEGESWRSTRLLSLSEDGDSLTVTGDGTSMVRVRCLRGEL